MLSRWFCLLQAESAPHTNGGYTEAQYRAHMNLRKDALARLGSVWVQEDMVSCLTPVMRM